MTYNVMCIGDAAMFMRRILVVAILGLMPAGLCNAAAWQPRVNPDNLRDTITVQIIGHAEPAIVSITAKKVVTQQVNIFGNMFLAPGFPELERRGLANFLGSGFIIQKNGYVVTNNHVVDQAQQISVTLSNGKKYAARVVGSDPQADLAILKINATAGHTFPTLALGDSATLMIGEPTIAVGNPFGFNESVSSGIVSAVGREIHEPNNPVPLKNLIQTDAAINPGNSGGPLLNAYGQVIGINTAIRGNAQNIGFAIGVNRLVELISTLMNPESSTGVLIPVTLTDQRSFEPPATVRDKVVVAGTHGPAVQSIDHIPAPNLLDAYAALLRVPLTQKSVTIQFSNGTMKRYPVSPAPPRPAELLAKRIILAVKQIMGCVVQQVTPALDAKFNLGVKNGLLIMEVNANSMAAKAGLKPGDVLVQFGPYRIRTLQDLGALLPRLPNQGQIRVMVVRHHRLGVGVLTLP
jgi:serine protease Do